MAGVLLGGTIVPLDRPAVFASDSPAAASERPAVVPANCHAGVPLDRLTAAVSDRLAAVPLDRVKAVSGDRLTARAAQPASRPPAEITLRRSDVVFMYDNAARYESYGCTVLGWAGRANAAHIQKAHAQGVRLFSTSIGFRTEGRGVMDFATEFLNAACSVCVNFVGGNLAGHQMGKRQEHGKSPGATGVSSSVRLWTGFQYGGSNWSDSPRMRPP